MFNINNITRKNILQMKPYSSARSEFKGEATVFLDANENPNQTNLNRYPDPLQTTLKDKISAIKSIDSSQIFLGNGSDEAIDLLYRAFCEPGKDKAFVFPPTYGMYTVSAAINNIEVVELPLTSDFQIPAIDSIANQISTAGLLFICSPNNPTGNTICKESIVKLANSFSGIVVLDEAYVDFSDDGSLLYLLDELPNLVILQTFSKAWGLAGLRVGMAFASREIIDVLNKIKPPYNINILSQAKVLESLGDLKTKSIQVDEIKSERERLVEKLSSMDNVVRIYPSQANFILVEFTDAQNLFKKLIDKGIILRDRTKQVENCIRITVGTVEENNLLLKTLNELGS